MRENNCYIVKMLNCCTIIIRRITLMLFMKKFPVQLIYPVLTVMLFDFAFTMYGQPDSYWTNYANVNEGSPLGFNLLSQNPIFFILFFVLYLVIVNVLLRILPVLPSLILGISLFLGHAWGSGSWVPYILLKQGIADTQFLRWYSVIVYFIFLSTLTSFFILRFIKQIRTGFK